MTLKRSLSFLFASLSILSLAGNLHAQQDRELIRLGNGIAAIAEGEIITLQQLRKELEPIIPRLRVEAKSEQQFAARIDQLSKEVLQNMIDRILIVKAAEEKGQ